MNDYNDSANGAENDLNVNYDDFIIDEEEKC